MGPLFFPPWPSSAVYKLRKWGHLQTIISKTFDYYGNYGLYSVPEAVRSLPWPLEALRVPLSAAMALHLLTRHHSIHRLIVSPLFRAAVTQESILTSKAPFSWRVSYHLFCPPPWSLRPCPELYHGLVIGLWSVSHAALLNSALGSGDEIYWF